MSPELPILQQVGEVPFWWGKQIKSGLFYLVGLKEVGFFIVELKGGAGMKKFVLSLGITFVSLVVFTQEIPTYQLGKIVVTATKTEHYQAEVGSSTTVITAEEMEKTGKRTVGEFLQDVLGISVAQNGAFGGLTSVYLRGSKPGYTLVMIDGVEVNDPMTIERSFDFAHLLIDDIQKIEVVRGSQSTLYGSDAIGGVINIITKKGEGKPKWQVLFEGGSYSTFKKSLSYSGSGDKFNYHFSLIRLDSDGISEAEEACEDDAYRNTTFSSRLGYKVLENADLDLVFRYVDAKADLDDGAYEDDPDYTAWWKNIMSKITFNQAVNPFWSHKLSFSYSRTKRIYRDDPDSVDIFDNTHNWYIGDNKKFEWQNNFIPADWGTITGGVEYEEERGFSDGRNSGDRFDRKTVNNKGYYLQDQIKLWDKFFTTLGIRVDDHQLFDIETTYKISIACIIPQIGVRLRANWGTGFKAPSLFQLYSSYGDPNLNPDESNSYDLGFEQSLLSNKVSFGLTYFHNKFKNMVDFDMTTFKYKNIGRAKTKGIEAEVSFKPWGDLEISMNYTSLDTKNKETGKELGRRPKHQAFLEINYKFLNKGNLNVSTTYVGSRWDDSANTKRLKQYAKVDLTVTYNLRKNFQIFARAENLFDKNYMQTRGYKMPGASFYTGVKVNF